MAGARVEIELDDAAVKDVLKQASVSLAPPGVRKLLVDIGEYLVRSTRERSLLEVSPDGMPWQPLSEGYAAFKLRKRPGKSMLHFDEHMLGDQLSAQVSDATLLVGTNAKYGAIHQFGGEIKIAARSQHAYFRRDKRTGEVGNQFVKKSKSNFAQWVTLPAYTITMPARPWLGVSEADRTEIAQLTLDHIRAALDAG